MIHFLTIGIILGLSAGFAPGPLLTLVISETLQHNINSGVKVALAPIITDLPTQFNAQGESQPQPVPSVRSPVGRPVEAHWGFW
jgi:hypothetical protein